MQARKMSAKVKFKQDFLAVFYHVASTVYRGRLLSHAGRDRTTVPGPTAGGANSDGTSIELSMHVRIDGPGRM
jgi:hypothetical protein